MRNKSLFMLLVFILAAATSWAQFWKDYSDKDRKSVAEAYWLVGKQYRAVGKARKGAELMSLARAMDPALDPALITEKAMPSAAQLPAGGTSPAAGVGADQIPEQSLDSFFLRFVGALLAGDPAAASSFLDGSVYLSKAQSAVTRADAESALEKFSLEAPLAGKGPSDLYSLDSVTVRPVPRQDQAAWGDAYTLGVDAAADYSAYLGFWEAKQKFFVHRIAGGWSIFAIGGAPPPLTWKPEAAAPVVAAPPSRAGSDSEASKAIMDAFSACLADLLKKDTDGAAGYIAETISLLRLRQSVTRTELKTTLEGSLENADLGSLQVADAVDLDSAFVERAPSPVDGAGGDVFSLSIRARQDLTKALPFWTSYQRYYFANDNGQWKVFALY